MPSPPTRRLVRALAAGLLAVGALAGCSVPASDGGRVIVTTDDRVEEVRAARAALAAPVPAFASEAERLTEALERVWVEEGSAAERAALAEALQVGPFVAALEALEAVELAGDGPDVVTAAGLVDDMVGDGRALLDAVDTELASVTAPVGFDDELEALLAGWDARGSYSQQLTAFEELAVAAEQLAAEADGRSAVPSCVGLWPRRSDAASTVAERTRELRGLIRDRRGQEFDELRDTYRQDPYGTGALLGVLDARAAQDCWAGASDAPPLLGAIQEHVSALGAALDPDDLQG